MPDDNASLSRLELLQGTLDMLILQTLRWGPAHGYGIGQMIRAGSQESLQLATGSLYPALRRLARRKWIAAEWQMSDRGQRIRVYSLTATGRKQLAVERSRWERLTRAIAGAMQRPAIEEE